MPRARWTILSGKGLAVVAGLGFSLAGCDSAERQTASKAVPVTAPGAKAGAAAPAALHAPSFANLERGEAAGAEAFFAAVRSKDEDLTRALPAEQLAWLTAARAGFEKLDPVHRAQVVSAVSAAVVRMSVEPAPEGWGEALGPAAEIYTLAMGDASPAVRVGAAEAVGHLWVWQPAVALAADQERALGAWKERLYTPLASLLKDAEPAVRLTAVKALGNLPIDEKAAPAVALIGDPHTAVRLQVLNSFAARRDVLSEEDILPRLFDPEPTIVTASLAILKARGLADDLIALGQKIYHPEASQRLGAIADLSDRTDIDPVVWLLRLSFDRDEAVRVAAVKALAERTSPEAFKRVSEMAREDPSETVRQSAAELLPRMTAALPPLPGTRIPSPTAN